MSEGNKDIGMNKNEYVMIIINLINYTKKKKRS